MLEKEILAAVEEVLDHKSGWNCPSSWIYNSWTRTWKL